jgi:hypothetical protein
LDVKRQSPFNWIVWPEWSGLVSERVDLLLDGLVCEQCGVYLEEAVGYPRKCRACERLRDGETGTREEEAEWGFPID